MFQYLYFANKICYAVFHVSADRQNYYSVMFIYDGPRVKEQIKNFIFTTVYLGEKIKKLFIFTTVFFLGGGEIKNLIFSNKVSALQFKSANIS